LLLHAQRQRPLNVINVQNSLWQNTNTALCPEDVHSSLADIFVSISHQVLFHTKILLAPLFRQTYSLKLSNKTFNIIWTNGQWPPSQRIWLVQYDSNSFVEPGISDYIINKLCPLFIYCTLPQIY